MEFWLLYILELLNHIFNNSFGLSQVSRSYNFSSCYSNYYKFENGLGRALSIFNSAFKAIFCAFFLTLYLLTSGCSSSGKPQVVERGTSSSYNQNKKNKVHIVRKGDTLFSIASYYGQKVSKLAKCNKLGHPYTIHPGEKIATTCSVNNKTRKKKKSHRSQKANKKASNINKKHKKSRNVEQVTVLARWRWPTIGHVVRRFNPGNQGKTGLEIAGKYRQSIYAAEAGKVVYSGSGLIGYGKLIIVKHNRRFLTAYGYNSELLVKEGDSVKSGQVIARMGRSPSNKAALFFELRKDGKPVNPMRYLPKK